LKRVKGKMAKEPMEFGKWSVVGVEPEREEEEREEEEWAVVLLLGGFWE